MGREMIHGVNLEVIVEEDEPPTGCLDSHKMHACTAAVL